MWSARRPLRDLNHIDNMFAIACLAAEPSRGNPGVWSVGCASVVCAPGTPSCHELVRGGTGGGSGADRVRQRHLIPASCDDTGAPSAIMWIGVERISCGREFRQVALRPDANIDQSRSAHALRRRSAMRLNWSTVIGSVCWWTCIRRSKSAAISRNGYSPPAALNTHR